MTECFTTNDLKFAFKRIRQLEDYNFILNQKIIVYEHVLSFLLNLNSWTQCLLAYLINDDTKNEEYEYSLDILNIPNRMIEKLKSNINNYQKKLDLEIESRNIKLEYEDTGQIDLFSLNEKFNFINDIIRKKKINRTYQFSDEFVNDLDFLFKKHGIELNKNNFIHCLDATKFVFLLLNVVFIHVPVNIITFDATNVANSIESLKSWIKSNFSNYCVKIMNQSFYLNPSVYSTHFYKSLISSSEYMITYEEIMNKFLKSKRNEINVYSKSIDLNCFDKFLEFYKDRIQNIKLNSVLNEKANFKNDLINELLFLTNTILALPNNKTEFDSLRQNYLVENWLLKKFLFTLLVNITSDLSNDSLDGIFNPIRLLYN